MFNDEWLMMIVTENSTLRIYAQFLISTKWPSIAAATAIAGDTRWVLPPAPWRPSKFLLLVEAQRSPG
jgi:hypothetical protein